MIHEASDPLIVMRRVVDQAIGLIPASDGAVIELPDGDHLIYVCAAGSLVDHLGTRVARDASLSGLAVATGETLYCADSTTDERVDRDACARIGERSFVCIPLRQGSAAIGVLKVSAAGAGAFTGDDVALLSRLAGFVAAAIGAISDLSRAAAALVASPQLLNGATMTDGGMGEFVANVLRPGIVRELEDKERIAEVLAQSRFHMLCQPIVEIDSGRVLGAEALARFDGPPAQPPDRWFAQAAHAGLGVPLELAAATKALTLLDQLPPGTFLAINLGPDALADPQLPGLLKGSEPERVVIELTEHVRVDDYPHMRHALQRLRGLGVRLAIDDTGAGFAGLAHIVNLKPDLIKLDRQFAHQIDTDPARRAVARSLVSLASETGAQMIAEGIETNSELDTIRALGIPYGQGYLFSRPGSANELQTAYPSISPGPVHRLQATPAGRRHDATSASRATTPTQIVA